ncbi:MAG TPA: hypothetical protein VKS60_00670 [Stellaceae bacterium]|nr:hypothetical protein [Stellaceae bacterium]
MELTRYDDYPVHQSPYPFSYIPASDPAWDEGYYFGVFNVETGLYLMTGMRINPNSDMIGGHAGISVRGVERTLRLSREWRKNCDTHLGPLRYEFIEPFKDIRISLQDNPSGYTFDLHWYGIGPAHLSSHHLAMSRGRRVTDQTRYNQVGEAEGWIALNGERHEVTRGEWGAVRDHSWGIYEGRPPLAPPAKFLPPPEVPPVKRALRFSVFFQTDKRSGHFHLHEDEQGRQLNMNDAFGIAFEGAMDTGWETPRLPLAGARHKLVFAPGTRSVTTGSLEIDDVAGRTWHMTFEVTAPPYVILPIGYHLGAWKDGGTIHTYHGPADPVMEWDEFDFRVQPTEHTLYGEAEPRKLFGVEHIARIKLTAPDGTVEHGKAQIEVFLSGRYDPYGFTDPVTKAGHGLVGRGIV